MLIRRVEGDSMWPTLASGQVVIAWRRRPIVGDLVIAKVDKREVVKRLHEIKKDKVFLRGDNPSASTDSRQYGFLPKEAILGVIMIKLPKSQPPVALQYKYGTYMGWLAAAVMLFFALLHLFRIDTLIPEINRALPGGDGWAIFAVVAIITMEVYALPFLMRMRLSPLASFLSGLFGVIVPLVWLLITIWNYNTGVSTGQFGEFKSAPVNIWLLAGNVFWLIYAYATLWALGFDKAYSPALQRLAVRRQSSKDATKAKSSKKKFSK